jgi:hypothetical protein
LKIVDKAEQVKKCIAHYESDHNIKYVMLVGDVDKLPIRYFLVQTSNDTGSKIDWFAYYMTDHYYADLYDSGGALELGHLFRFQMLMELIMNLM